MFTTAFVVWMVAAPMGLSEAAKKELNAIEGEWIVVALARDGAEWELPADEQIPVSIIPHAAVNETFP
jgi:hypothetical protein